MLSELQNNHPSPALTVGRLQIGAQKAKALREVIQWWLTEGRKYDEELGYVPLPSHVVQKASVAAKQITP